MELPAGIRDSSSCHEKQQIRYSKNLRVKPYSGLRTCCQKFAFLISRDIRTSLAKQDQASSYLWFTVKLSIFFYRDNTTQFTYIL